MEIIIDKKLKLEFIKKSHAKELYELTDSNREYLDKWLPWVKNTNSSGDTLKFIINCIEKIKSEDGFHFIIKYAGKIAGVISLFDVSRFFGRAEIGYWLGEEFTGKGIMTKCCKVLIDYGFREKNLNRIIIRCDVRNKASRGIPERLNLFKQGILKHDGMRDGKFLNHVQYLVYKKEWENIRK